MGRQIITKSDLMKIRTSAGDTSDVSTADLTKATDGYLDKLLKLIPAEIVAAYIFVEGVILQQQSPAELSGLYWLIFFIFLVITPLYLWRIQHVMKVTQLIISFVAFAVWIFALGGPFTLMHWYKPIYGDILLPVFTLVAALVNPEK